MADAERFIACPRVLIAEERGGLQPDARATCLAGVGRAAGSAHSVPAP
jgi:hypothetical protein